MRGGLEAASSVYMKAVRWEQKRGLGSSYAAGEEPEKGGARGHQDLPVPNSKFRGRWVAQLML